MDVRGGKNQIVNDKIELVGVVVGRPTFKRPLTGFRLNIHRVGHFLRPLSLIRIKRKLEAWVSRHGALMLIEIRRF